MFSTYILLKHGTFTSECHLQGIVFMSFSSLKFTSTLKLKTHSQLTQSPFKGTDCLSFFIHSEKRRCFMLELITKWLLNFVIDHSSLSCEVMGLNLTHDNM